MNIIMTGTTGTLGSNVLFELLQQEQVDQIFLLIRKKNGKSPEERLNAILNSGAAPESILKQKDILIKKVKVLDANAFFNPESFLKKEQNNFFIHSAGYVNLSTHESQKEEIFKENLGFTKEIFNTFYPYLSKFIYISTAFCIGNIGGLINNDYHDSEIKPIYRNFYEESKHKAEQFLKQEGSKRDVAIQILRPSVLGGNIFEQSKFFISKFMVYYLLGKFFYKNPITKNAIRITANINAGLNIIPVDYAAKVISKVFHLKEINQLNIVHPKCTHLKSGISKILESVNFKSFTIVDSQQDNEEELANMNVLEKLYYNSIGVHLKPYLTSKPYEFETKLLELIYPMPNYDLDGYLEQTMKFAIAKNFKNERY
ncbi:NAD-dependent epimerase/dehydratase family protein [Flavobacteriaceae bacterium R38]|nr:NAD-dependent epimerase/dehydratase family protein [Flavobacteriaceae bacterium R38]